MIWLRPESLSDNDQIMSIGEIATNKKWVLAQEGVTPKLRIEIEGSGYNTALQTSTNIWQFVGVILDGTTLGDNTVFLDAATEAASGAGVINTTDSVQIINKTIDNLKAGDAKYAHSVLWNTNLPETHRLALFHGVNPFPIFHSNQVINYPIDGNNSPENDHSGNSNSGILTGTTKFAGNPPVQLLSRYMSSH